MSSVCKAPKEHYSSRIVCPECGRVHRICIDENIVVYPKVAGINGTVFRCQECDLAYLIDDLLSGNAKKKYREFHRGKPPKKMYIDNICMICKEKRIYYDRERDTYICDGCGELFDAFDIY